MLKELLLYANEITDINVLEFVNFKKIEMLSFGINKIKDINVLDKVDFKEIKTIGFSKNRITDINVLKKIHFPKLKKLTFDYNGIDEKEKENSLILSDYRNKYDYFYYSEDQDIKRNGTMKEK